MIDIDKTELHNTALVLKKLNSSINDMTTTEIEDLIYHTVKKEHDVYNNFDYISIYGFVATFFNVDNVPHVKLSISSHLVKDALNKIL